MPTYTVIVGDAVLGYTSEKLPSVGEVITPDGTDWRIRVENVGGGDVGGSILGSCVASEPDG
jgi:hypothetical protein